MFCSLLSLWSDPEGEPILPLTVERVASVLRCQHLCTSEVDALSVARALNPPLGPSCRDVGRVVQALGTSLRLTPCPKYHLWKALCVPPLAPVRVVERRPSCIRVSVVGLWEVHDVKSTCTLLEVTVQGRGHPVLCACPWPSPVLVSPHRLQSTRWWAWGLGPRCPFDAGPGLPTPCWTPPLRGLGSPPQPRDCRREHPLPQWFTVQLRTA